MLNNYVYYTIVLQNICPNKQILIKKPKDKYSRRQESGFKYSYKNE